MNRRLFIPHHVTGFWTPVYSESELTTGSIGAGILLGGALAFYHGDYVSYNGAMLEVGVGARIASPFPLGYGYAGSAVVSIAKAVAEAGLGREAFVKAHVEEVLRGTGLGDVLAIYTGGCLVVRTRPGAPGVGEAFSLPCPGLIVVAVDLRREDTSEMLKMRRDAILEAGGEAVRGFMRNPSFESFLEHAYLFSKRVGFLSGGLADLRRLPGVVGLYAKKGVLLIFVERDKARDVAEAVRGFGGVHLAALGELRVTWV
ncbi:putative archaeal kinase (sugar kinase superfamily) [Pyrobaculum oguniense TE7]|uniref:Pantoate kinase n=1 Tax=Pyrobaculum oguniense (strain DSM 13380 / JCM 10595 / TE7) TaxID=698757 RepID=H6Q6I9_PYROT|nr:putative archaeal kinase (sugar kinase superfamily) [Pyrobaculum oguniense TE7]